MEASNQGVVGKQEHDRHENLPESKIAMDPNVSLAMDQRGD